MRGINRGILRSGDGVVEITPARPRFLRAARKPRPPPSCVLAQTPRSWFTKYNDGRATEPIADQGLVADESEGQADQDRREGGEPRPLCYLPHGRGRHRTANVPRDFAAHRGATAAATSGSVRRSMSCISRQKECVQMPGKMARSDPRPSIRTRGAGSGQHLASVLQEGRENANIDAGLGFIWGISDQKLARTHRQSVALAATLATRCGSRHPRSSTSAHPRTASCRSADQKKRPRRGVPRPRSRSRVTRRPSGAREAACCRSASLTKKWTCSSRWRQLCRRRRATASCSWLYLRRPAGTLH